MKTLLKSGTIAAFSAMPFAAAADYPEKPVEFVVPFPPGDLEDILTRMIADEFQATYNVPAAVVNKPGGGGGPFPGAVDVAMAPADGYTVGSFVIDVPLVGPHLGIPPLEGNPFEPGWRFRDISLRDCRQGRRPLSYAAGTCRLRQRP